MSRNQDSKSIPWRFAKLGDILEKPASGYSPNTYNEPAKEGEVGVLKLSAINNGIFIPTQNKKVIEHEADKLKTKIRKDSLLISRSNTAELVGAVAYIEEDFPNLYIPDLIWQAQLKKNSNSYMKWLSYVLCSPMYRKEIIKRANGTSGSMKKITKPSFLKIKVPLPEYSEQKDLAILLETWDHAIVKTNDLMNAKRKLKLAYMQKLLFGVCRFKKFNSKTWDNIRIKDVLEPRDEKLPNDGKFPLFSLTIEDGITPKTARYNRENLVKNKTQKKYKVVYPDDIVYNPSNLRWGAIGISKVRHPVLVSPIYEVLKNSNEEYDTNFLFQLLSSPRQIRVFERYAEGTLIERTAVKLNTFLKINITVPSDTSEQKTISYVLNLFDQEIELLKTLKGLYQNQQKGILRFLLTGNKQKTIEALRLIA